MGRLLHDAGHLTSKKFENDREEFFALVVRVLEASL